jgi:hypothetical protein
MFIALLMFYTATLPFAANLFMDGYRSATPEYDIRAAIVCLAIGYFLAYAGLLFCAFTFRHRASSRRGQQEQELH